jgi:FKBP-type peptidyl-prolyl cis-trans isomerase 2
MSAAQIGDTVLIHYTGKLDDGSVFDTSHQRGPLRVSLGETRLIPGFQKAVLGMQPGESKTATVPAAEAYGDHKAEMVLEVERANLPPEVTPKVGLDLQLQTQTGQPVPAKIVDVSDKAVTIDANHPLAGRALTFDIELVKIVATA